MSYETHVTTILNGATIALCAFMVISVIDTSLFWVAVASHFVKPDTFTGILFNLYFGLMTLAIVFVFKDLLKMVLFYEATCDLIDKPRGEMRIKCNDTIIAYDNHREDHADSLLSYLACMHKIGVMRQTLNAESTQTDETSKESKQSDKSNETNSTQDTQQKCQCPLTPDSSSSSSSSSSARSQADTQQDTVADCQGEGARGTKSNKTNDMINTNVDVFN